MKRLIPLLLLFVSLPSLAQRQFDIEVIIFKRAVDAEKVNESWPNTQPKISLERVGSFQDTQYRASKGVKMLPYSEYKLTPQKDKLKQHAGFEVLMHTAWRQGDQGKSSAPVFHIQAGKDFSKQFNADGSEKGAVTASADGFQEETIDKPLYELDGKLQIYVQHYLYAETTLDLKAPSVREVKLQEQQIELDSPVSGAESNVQVGNLTEISPTVEVEEFLKSYRMEQKRRMRSTETHYLDHPLLGMVIQVRRVAQ
ncbi:MULTISPECIES: peptidoglycan binding protein CsiV [Vibrio]|uniref:Peptidoglycan-binding protein CsiV n=1 Tax=Vibrio chagasii TaxID=170679 RepID=A0A7Y3YSH5_9VIBR|nr:MULTISPECIES: peptidoglycan binding protein CsiV [Vibrio]MDE9382561.1 peptidoglycan binding protein CsiV [Vibrio alginolyticus]MCG9567534.1 peptidoglycan binding protein CsiV [Vibrio chagasii]MCG9603471.1 peptidoglycan binding protein CsiV [Vibrio chagasii]MCG9674260.1 peptidoglycan binding protein CsiV [Vibrio chagasii]MCG9692528.1 peptidoglycan binding protein CsiV [Vibrio sp. Isolate22]